MDTPSVVYTFSIFSRCRAPAFSSSTLPSASTSRSPTSTTLSPKAAAISSRVLCRVSLFVLLAVNLRLQHHLCTIDNIDSNQGVRVRVGVRSNSREIEICDDEEECSACDENIVVVLRGGKRLLMLPYVIVALTSRMLAKAVGPASVIPTFTMK